MAKHGLATNTAAQRPLTGLPAELTKQAEVNGKNCSAKETGDVMKSRLPYLFTTHDLRPEENTWPLHPSHNSVDVGSAE